MSKNQAMRKLLSHVVPEIDARPGARSLLPHNQPKPTRLRDMPSYLKYRRALGLPVMHTAAQ